MDRREDYKGHRQLIAAWPRVLESVPDAELRIVGSGDLRKDLERLAAQLGLADRVRFYGNVPDDVKERLIVECRCLAMPSRGEGFGLAYIEAMRKGRPCLVSVFDAGREVVHPPEGGLAVDPDRTGELAGALAQLLSGDAWPGRSRAAKERFEALYTAAAHRSRLLAALENVQAPR
jgi:phosphatidylinositol alpha-1,6-mannosyltransferase